MKCSKIEARLDDYVDGTLRGEEAAAVGAHLEGCDACRRAAEEIRRLAAQTKALPGEIMPARNLWSGIAQRIEASAKDPAPATSTPRAHAFRAARRWGGALAAATLLLVGVGLFLHANRGAVLRPRAVPQPAAETPALLGDLEAEYREARRELAAAVEARRESLAPETVVVLEENLQVIEDAVREIRDALQQDPDNPRLMRLLMATHRKELDFLAAVVRLPDQG